MKKLLLVSLSVCFIMVMTAFLLPSVKKVNSLPDEMVVTYSDIQNSNDSDENSSFINLELPKNVNVANNGELIDTVLNVKLFNLIFHCNSMHLRNIFK